MEFINTHTILLQVKSVNDKGLSSINVFSYPVEVDCDSEINSLNPIPLVKEEKVEPMDDFPTFYTTTLIDLVNAGYDIHLIPIEND